MPMPYLITLLLLIAFSVNPVRAATTAATTNGNCSPALAQSEVKGDVIVLCPSDQGDLRQIATLLTQLSKQQGFDREQMRRLVRLMNELISLEPKINRIDANSQQANTNSKEILDQLRVLSAEPAQPNIVLHELEEWARERKPPLAQKFDAILARFNRQSFLKVHASLEEPGFVVPVSSTDSAFRTADGGTKIYFLKAATDLSRGDGPTCDVEDGVRLIGTVAAGKRNSHGVEANMVGLKENDPVLRRICAGLAKPASTLLTNPAVANSSFKDMTVFDYLSIGHGVVVIVLIPDQKLDPAEVARGYWATALLTDLVGENAVQPDRNDPDVVAGLLAVGQGGDFSFSQSLPSPLLQGSSDQRYPAEAVKKYGSYIQDLDGKWLQYLRSASVTIHGKKIDLMVGDRFAAISPSFSSEELGNADFWRHAADFKIYTDQLNCIGARFAVDEGYANTLDLPAYDQCSAWQIQTDR